MDGINARDERDQVLEERNRATTVSNFLVELFALPDPTRIQGETVTARQLLDSNWSECEERGLTRLGLSLTNLADCHSVRGSLEQAETLYRQALETWSETVGETAVPALHCRRNLAEMLYRAGDYDAAIPEYRRWIEAAPFVAVASAGPSGIDCSPRGDAEVLPRPREILELEIHELDLFLFYCGDYLLWRHSQLLPFLSAAPVPRGSVR